METAVQRRETHLPAPMVETMRELMPRLPAVLPPDISTEQFRAALFLELSGRHALAECTPASLRDCVLKAAMHGLLPGRDCHILPFRNKKGGARLATYVPNYQGIILALERTGKIRRAFAHPVYEGDEWEMDLFADRPVHKPAVTLGRAQGKELFYYGAIMFKDGTCAFEVVTLEDLEAIRRRSPAHDEGPWVTDRVMMCRKTAIKRVAKYVQLTPAVQGLLQDEDAREFEDIAPERHARNVVDLFGDQAGTQASLEAARQGAVMPDAVPQAIEADDEQQVRAEIIQRINQLHSDHGYTLQHIAGYWRRQEQKRFHVAPGTLTIAQLEGLEKEAQEYYESLAAGKGPQKPQEGTSGGEARAEDTPETLDATTGQPEAHNEAFPPHPDTSAWRTLLAHCRNPAVPEALRRGALNLLARTDDVPEVEAFGVASTILDALEGRYQAPEAQGELV